MYLIKKKKNHPVKFVAQLAGKFVAELAVKFVAELAGNL